MMQTSRHEDRSKVVQGVGTNTRIDYSARHRNAYYVPSFKHGSTDSDDWEKFHCLKPRR